MKRRCITVSYGRVRGAAKKYSYYQPAEYAEHVTADGRTVWKLVSERGTARRSMRLAEQDAQGIAADEGIPYLSGIRQWAPVQP